MSMNVEAEIRDLKRRVGELEGSFGFLTQQVQNVHKDLLAFEEKTEQRFNIVDQRLIAWKARLMPWIGKSTPRSMAWLRASPALSGTP